MKICPFCHDRNCDRTEPHRRKMGKLGDRLSTSTRYRPGDPTSGLNARFTADLDNTSIGRLVPVTR